VLVSPPLSASMSSDWSDIKPDPNAITIPTTTRAIAMSWNSSRNLPSPNIAILIFHLRGSLLLFLEVLLLCYSVHIVYVLCVCLCM